MAQDKSKIIALAKNFKDEVLLPLSQEGLLEEELLDEALEVYLGQLVEHASTDRPVIINENGEWKELHPFLAGPIIVGGVSWPTIEHYRIASAYFGGDQDLIDNIREAKNPTIAHRRAENANAQSVHKRFDFDDTRDSELKTAYMLWLHANPDLLKRLKATEKANIVLEQFNDSYMGITKIGKGNNAVGKILSQLRVEL
uniref:NADAR domain-containing protein n=1 Tax=viral metagenome TaxID=1070528 RepID=A0A6C0CID6_9ZZZZ